MTRAVVVLHTLHDRQRAMTWARNAPPGTRVEFKEAKRSTEQNAAMWAALTEISVKATHHGLKLTPDDWKLLFLDALKREVRMVPNLDGNGIVSLGRSSSDLSKAEMSDLLEIINAWAAAHDIDLHSGNGAGGANNSAQAA